MFLSLFLPVIILNNLSNNFNNNQENLLSNEMISLDKNLGAFYVDCNTVLDEDKETFFYYKLDKRLASISECISYQKMGIEITYIDKYNCEEFEKYTIASNSFIQLFEIYDSIFEYKNKFENDNCILSYKYYTNSEVYEISLNSKICCLKNISIYYGDNSVNLSSAYLGYRLDEVTCIDSLPPYKDNKCNYKLLYTDRINYLESNFGYSLSLSFLKRHYRIIDSNSEKIYEIETYDNVNNSYSSNEFLVGSRYYINVKSVINNVEASVEIKVVDNLSPIIEKWYFDNIKLDTEIFSNINERINEYIYIDDNYSKKSFLKIEITTNNSENISGYYYFFLQAEDQFKNTNEYKFLVTVIDKTKPIIKPKYTYTTTYHNNRYTEEDLLSFFVIEEKESLLKILVINNTYFGNEDVIGRYIFEIKAIDNNGNYSTSLIYIEVIDSNSNNLKNYYHTFYYYYQDKITLERIISILILNGEIPMHEYEFYEIVEGEDFNTNLVPGEYFFVAELKYQEITIYEEFIIVVFPKETIENNIKFSFIDFVKKLFYEIQSFFGINGR